MLSIILFGITVVLALMAFIILLNAINARRNRDKINHIEKQVLHNTYRVDEIIKRHDIKL